MRIYYIALYSSWGIIWSNCVGVILLYRRYYRILEAKSLLRPKKLINNIKMAPHIINLSYNLEYFTVVEITGLSKRPNRTKKLGRPLPGVRYYLVDYINRY
jgi:hypothetical protein